jgi:hypothetical protein
LPSLADTKSWGEHKTWFNKPPICRSIYLFCHLLALLGLSYRIMLAFTVMPFLNHFGLW